VITNYLTGHSETFYNETARVIVLRYSRIYNKAPDIAIIEKHLDEILRGIPTQETVIEYKQDIASDEEKQFHIEQMKELFKKETPMAAALKDVVENIEGLSNGKKRN